MQYKGVHIAMMLLALVAVSANRPNHGSGGHCKCQGTKCPCNNHCVCPDVYDPVCGSNDQTYNNACLAKCAHVTVQCNQKCPCPKKCEDHCPKTYHHVCGSNGQTYNNDCLAKCDHATVKCNQKCPCPKCEDHCTKIYKPVCGKNGKQYDNECLAKCAGTTVACPGHCPCKPTCIRENGACDAFSSIGNHDPFKKCCPGLECCYKYGASTHNPITATCEYKCK